MEVKQIFKKIIQKQDLSSEESAGLLADVMQGVVSDIEIASLLTALTMKGETVDEMIGCIQAMRDNMTKVTGENAIDVCGTGGDGKQTFNISTAVAFVVAGCGVNVAKHGNRAVSSNCGSADVLEELGVNIYLDSKCAREVLQKAGMVFLFAPLFHPAMKTVAHVRKTLGFRTMFNVLGPFTNPAGVKRQLVGVPSVSIAEKLAQVALALPYERVMIVTSEDGMDEVSINKKTYVYDIHGKDISRFVFDPKAYGFAYPDEVLLTGGDAKQNASIINSILSGENSVYRDVVVCNSALALVVAGKAKDIAEGIGLAEKAIDTGAAKKVLHTLREISKN